jgi:hypothetical protein
MKNASQIITTIQYKPQYKRILQHKCVKKLTSVMLPAIQKSIKYGYIKDGKLHFVITSTLDKYDRDNIINTIKTILNGNMIEKSENLVECLGEKIDDVIIKVDHKPLSSFKPYATNAEKLCYFERSSGAFSINIEDKKLFALAQEIQKIIQDKA